MCLCVASCFERSCSEHAECVENIGNYTCKCNPGFTGPRCNEGTEDSPNFKTVSMYVCYILYSLSLFAAVECGMVKNPEQGSVQCKHVYGEFRFDSSCHFYCARGYILKGSKHIHCLSLGQWDSEPPECQGREWYTVFVLLISLHISIALMFCSCFITCFSFQCL